MNLCKFITKNIKKKIKNKYIADLSPLIIIMEKTNATRIVNKTFGYLKYFLYIKKQTNNNGSIFKTKPPNISSSAKKLEILWGTRILYPKIFFSKINWKWLSKKNIRKQIKKFKHRYFKKFLLFEAK